MSIASKQFFEELSAQETFDFDLLERLLKIKSPMDFTDDFATDEQIATLISNMESEHTFYSIVRDMKRGVLKLRPTKTNILFI